MIELSSTSDEPEGNQPRGQFYGPYGNKLRDPNDGPSVSLRLEILCGTITIAALPLYGQLYLLLESRPTKYRLRCNNSDWLNIFAMFVFMFLCWMFITLLLSWGAFSLGMLRRKWERSQVFVPWQHVGQLCGIHDRFPQMAPDASWRWMWGGRRFPAISLIKVYYYGWFILSVLMITPHYFWLSHFVKGDDEMCRNLLKSGTLTTIHPTRL